MTDPTHLDRRRILALAAGAAALPALPAAAQVQTPPKAGAPAPATAKADGLPTVLIEAKPGFSEFDPGKVTDTWTLGGRAPAAELRLKPGEPFRARLVNGLPQPLSLHWHGLRLANEADGVAGLTQDAVAPGAGQDIQFTPPDSGTAISRPLVPGLSGELAARGVGGVVVVEEKQPPTVDLDMVVAVDDWRLGDTGAHAPFGDPAERAGIGRLGSVLTVNGRRAPETVSVIPGARVRLRLANLCNARILRVRFTGMKVYVIAVDGQPTDTFEPLRSTLPFAPGTRYDLIGELPPETASAKASVIALIGEGVPLLTLTADKAEAAPRRTALPPLAPLPENKALPSIITLERAQRADMVMEGGAPAGGAPYQGDPARIWRVNGASGPTAPGDKFGKPLLSVKRGSPVVLALANKTAFPQVLHLHGHVFRLLHALDDGWEPYWLDTVIVPEKQTARIAFIADNRGRWLIGSTILERFDTGLSAWLEVT